MNTFAVVLGVVVIGVLFLYVLAQLWLATHR